MVIQCVDAHMMQAEGGKLHCLLELPKSYTFSG